MHVATSSSPSQNGALLERGAPLPRSFGRYTLFELIGSGGMAQIYLARAETELGATKLCVVKQILPAFADDPKFAEMLTHEAKLAARLGHRHIVQVTDLGRADETLFIAMEYVEGFDLNALLRQCTEKGAALPAEHALGIVADVLEGLDYAHRCRDEDGEPLGIVHRDVSPSNVLISYEGEVKLCDFGIAHANDLVRAGAASVSGVTEALKGKAGYMSPEHARGEVVDARSDVFAVGIILWELLAGRRLYKPRTETPLLVQAQRAEIPPLPERGLPKQDTLNGIVRRALARDRSERYPSAGALLRELESYLAETSQLASRLKLGEWLETMFGTAVVERRRESERRLPRSTARSSWAMDVAARARPEGESRPPLSVTPRSFPISDGAMRAFKRDLAESRPTPRVQLIPESLAGASMDVPPSSREPSRDVPTPAALGTAAASRAELASAFSPASPLHALPLRARTTTLGVVALLLLVLTAIALLRLVLE